MKTILVPYYDYYNEAESVAAVEAACRLAKDFDAYVEGLLVMSEPDTTFDDDSLLDIVETSGDDARGRHPTRLADVERAHFKAIVTGLGLPFLDPQDSVTALRGAHAGWRELPGSVANVIGEYGRLFDLLVMGRYADFEADDWHVKCEAALFDTGKPVLLVPDQLPSVIGETVVIAWNGSTETARTIAFAMPILLRAKTILVVTVVGATVDGPDGEAVAGQLRRAGLNATARTVEPGARSFGSAILDEAHGIGADLLVKGAFTQTRVRQLIFGGATRDLLEHADLPLWIAH